jgi:D-alanine-D-alanine ligase
MKVAIVYNRESKKVINLFGVPNREQYGLKSIKRIVDALKKGKHHVIALEGDKDLVERLEEFMPRVVKGERPGMVFNLSYGIQGQARYTHVPGILEMVGIPYVGSGPLAHSLALDKVVAKVIFKQNGLPTPDFAVLQNPGFEMPDLAFPLIVKPKNEAVSMGIRIVNDEDELREAADKIFDLFRQPVLVEQYIEGREINVGLLGNSPLEVFAPAEIIFDDKGPPIYTLEDKKRTSERTIGVQCPALLSSELTKQAQGLAIRAFEVLECYDCARIDMRLDKNDNFYILEINSLPSLGEHGSYIEAARYMGLDFPDLVNRLVDVASARYFGIPEPPQLKGHTGDSETTVFNYLIERRDQMEKRVHAWTTLSSRSTDPVGINMAVNKLQSTMSELGLKQVRQFMKEPHSYVWETKAGLSGGSLLIIHLDVPLNPVVSAEPFRIDPEWIYGEGVGVSRAPLISMIYALRSLRTARILHKLPIGVLVYNDEGIDCRYSSENIRETTAEAKQVLVLRPGNVGDKVVTQRRGQRLYRITIEGKSKRLGQVTKSPEVVRWAFAKLEEISKLSSRKDRIAVSTIDMRTEAFPMLLPHRVIVQLFLSYLDAKSADAVETAMHEILKQSGFSVAIRLFSDRPPMRERRINAGLAKKLRKMAKTWDLALETESSLWPSVAGLVPSTTPVVCGLGPVAKDLNTSKEAVQRISLMERTLLLSEFLLQNIKE